MATATRQSAGDQLARRERNVCVLESMKFVVFEDDGGTYRWRIVAVDGATLAQSGASARYDRAAQAARRVRDRAASAGFDRRAGEVSPVEFAARRDGPSDKLDAERWLDEGGSFSSEAVAR
jgi:uncharacterized protein YegP (UPF0339 family)